MIVALISDLVLKSKIVEVAKHLESELTVVRSGEDLLKALNDFAVSKCLVDLNIKNMDVFEVLTQAHDLKPEAQIIGFYPHVEHEIGQRAEELGFVIVMPRSKFFGQLPELLG